MQKKISFEVEDDKQGTIKLESTSATNSIQLD